MDDDIKSLGFLITIISALAGAILSFAKIAGVLNCPWWVVILVWIPAFPAVAFLIFGIIVLIWYTFLYWLIYVYQLFTRGLED